MEERIIVLALCSFSRGALFSEVVMCSFSWILFLTARLGGSFKSYAHFKASISTRKGLLSKRLRSLQGIRSLCSMKKRCVKFTHRFASRVAKMEIRNVLRLSLRYLSSETDVGADNAEIFNFQSPACASMILPCDARSNAAHGTLAAEENHGSARASELE